MNLTITSYCSVISNHIIANGQLLFYQEVVPKFSDFAKAAFRQLAISYPRFHKMDNISKLGFIAGELVLKARKTEAYASDRIGVVLSNASASLDTDMAHQDTIRNRTEYFPSPSVFVYTLPNIVIGELCIRHKIKGENEFFITEGFEAALIFNQVSALFADNRLDACLCGWNEVLGNNFSALMMLVEKETMVTDDKSATVYPKFTLDNINKLLKLK